jgi:hypothetical protein
MGIATGEKRLGFSTRPLNGFIQGFSVMLVAIWACNIVALVLAGDVLTAVLFFLILLIPVSIIIYTVSKRQENSGERATVYEKLKMLLIPLHGAAFACWTFDVSTTFYAIDVVRKAAELNPLGWPLGAIGALIFYIPAIAFTYTLLFKIKQKTSLVAAVVITMLAACLGSMNFNAGVQNFGFFLNSVSFTMEGYSFLFSFVVAVDLIYAVAFAKLARREANLIKRTMK